MRATSLLTLLCLMSWSVVGPKSLASQLAPETRITAVVVQQDLKTKVNSAVQRLFGPDIEPAADRKPYYLVADFNGDNHEDLLVLVRVKSGVQSLAKEIKELNPWGYDSKNPPRSSPLAFAIVHGSAQGWDTQTPIGRFLLADKDFLATPIWTESQDAPISVRKRRQSKSNRRVTQPRLAKGDSVAVGTEAGIDVLLYWDGKSYRIYEPQDEP